MGISPEVQYREEEAKLKWWKHLIVWDLDDTLFSSDTSILITNGETRTEKILTTQEFKKYKAAQGDVVNFVYLNDAHVFAKSAVPIRATLTLFKLQQTSAKQLTNIQMCIVTGRNTFNDPSVFYKTLEGYGIDTGIIPVHCTGDLTIYDTTAEKKAHVIEQLLDTKLYDTVSMYDDDTRNLSAVEKVTDQYRKINYYPYKVTESGNIHPFVGTASAGNEAAKEKGRDHRSC